MTAVSLRLPDDIASRLNQLAKSTGRSKTFYIIEAIKEHIEDMEDVYLATATLERIKRGEERLLSSEEFWRGLDD